MILLTISILLCYIHFAAASSNYNYNVYKYDMAPTFTPDGRILQVEYASAAAELSLPIVAMQVDQETLILLTLKNSQTPQNRIVIIPSSSFQRDAPSPICIAMSGVLADSIALMQVGLDEASKRLQQLHTPITVLQLATVMANACQSHCFGGGIRPYGCTLLTCGFNSVGVLVLYQTDPSGALVEVQDPSKEASGGPWLRWLVGGTTTLQRKIRKRLESSLHKLQKKTTSTTTSLLEIVNLVGHTLIKESQKLDQNDKKPGAAPSTVLEVVMMNRKLGCYRLSQSEINTMMARL
jgi:hypothetical protein